MKIRSRTRYYCDICNEELNTQTSFLDWATDHGKVIYIGHGVDEKSDRKRFDLCSECFDRMISYLKEKAREEDAK